MITAVLFFPITLSLHWDEFDDRCEDNENDIVEFNLAEFRLYRERGKEYLDISSVCSYLENDTVLIEFAVHGGILDSNLVDYEVLLTIYDVTYRYGESDIILLYSDGKATMTTLVDEVDLDITDDTSVYDKIIIFRLPRSLFDDAELFDMNARATESTFDELCFFMDSTYPIEDLAEEKPSEYYVYYVLIIIGLVILAIVLLSSNWTRISLFKRKRVNLCTRCRGMIRDGDQFCYHCGEAITERSLR